MTNRITPIIDIEDRYIPLIKSGNKTTSIRKGIRFYPKGKSVFLGKKEEIEIDITTIEYKSFDKFKLIDAKHDGFENLNDLWKALISYYSDLTKEEILTIIKFKCISG